MITRRTVLGAATLTPLIRRHKMTSPNRNTLQGIKNTTILKPEQIWNGNSGVEPYIFNNNTDGSILYVGDKQAVLKQDTTSCIPIPSLSGSAWGDFDVYAFATSTVNALVIPGVTSWAPSPAQVQQLLQPNVSTLQLAGATPGTPKTGSSTKATRVWAVYLDVEISTDGTYAPAINNIQAQLTSGSSVLHQLDAKIFPASSVVNLNNTIPFPQSFPVPASQIFTLQFLNAAIAGVTQSANALIFFSTP